MKGNAALEDNVGLAGYPVPAAFGVGQHGEDRIDGFLRGADWAGGKGAVGMGEITLNAGQGDWMKGRGGLKKPGPGKVGEIGEAVDGRGTLGRAGGGYCHNGEGCEP
jgi:hypothetical protein